MIITEIVEIEKFLMYTLNKRIKNLKEKRLISGTFKEKGSNKEISGDEFMAYDLVGCSSLEVYECYIKYFNYTIQRPNEIERISVNAKWVEK